MPTDFSPDDARRFYDRYGAKQDGQGFYEDAALDALIRHGDFGAAQSVLEIGCGTGRFAARLLADHMPQSARYTGIDISSTMVGLTREMLEPWSDRCTIVESDGGFDFATLGGPFDRIVSTYVFDLLSPDDIKAALRAAHGAAKPSTLLCLAGLGSDSGPLSNVTAFLWSLLHRLRPKIVGGCRPLSLGDFLDEDQWRVVHREIVVSSAIASEVLLASPTSSSRAGV